MAKQASTHKITAEDLRKFVSDESDFAFEMQILKLVSKAGYRCEHSGTYIDPITGKIREFDIRAYFESGAVSLALAIECKNLRPTKPLLVSCMPRTNGEAFHEILKWNQVASASAFHIEKLSCLYPPKEMVGKKTDQVFMSNQNELSSDDQETFDKFSQAVNSCYDLVSKSGSYVGYNPHHVLRAVAPIMVVPDGTLWQADYAENGSIQQYPRQVSQVSRFIGHSSEVTNAFGDKLTYCLSHLNIVCESELPARLEHWPKTGGFFSR